MGIIRSLQDAPPAHYTLKIESFSSFLNRKTEKCESGLFEVGGYKWRLCVYPSGRKPGKECVDPSGRKPGKGHISLYLAIYETETLPTGWEVNAHFKMFVFDNDKDKYLTIQDRDGDGHDRVWRFHDKKREWGFKQFVSLEAFIDEDNGYLVDDTCEFGVEVFVVKYSGNGESLSLIELDPLKNSSEWTIKLPSATSEGEFCSPDFTVGEHKWIMSIYPRGNGTARGKYVSYYLKLAETSKLPRGRKLYAGYKLSLWKYPDDAYDEREGAAWFCASCDSHGVTEFILISDQINYISTTYNHMYLRAEIMVVSHATISLPKK